MKIFIGSEPYMRRADIALEYSIRRFHPDAEITWMNYSLGGLWSGWNIGRDYGHPASGTGWFTDFSNFRMAIPEAAGFEGRALYLDADMIVLKGLSDLIDSQQSAPIAIPAGKGKEPDAAVMVVDCAAFKNIDWWPSIAAMKSNQWSIRRYVQLLQEHNFIEVIEGAWYSVDGDNFGEDTAVLHFSYLGTQPWEPYSHGYEYPPHPRQDLAALWWKTYAEGLEHLQPLSKKGR